MNRLVEMAEIEVVAVVKAQPLPFSRQGKSRIKRQLQRVGWQFGWLLFYQRIVQAVGYGLSLLVPGLRKRLLPAWKIARQRNIPLHRCDNINDPASIELIRACRPDLLVSAYFSQILGPDVIQLPRLGVLNVHPGWLPSYRGAMSYFWVLHNRSQRGGVTVHWIDEGVDTGQILARKSFPIRARATQESVLTLTAVIGARLLRRVIRRLQRGEPAAIPSKYAVQAEENYYPMPGDREFASYFQQHRFFRIRDVLGLIAFRGWRR